MQLALPGFDQPFFEQIGLCSQIAASDANGIDLADVRTQSIARVDHNGQTLYARLVLHALENGDDDEDTEPLEVHVHLEVANLSFFSGDVPEANVSWDEMQATFDRVGGRPIESRGFATYDITRRELPQGSMLTRLLPYSVRGSGRTSARLTSGQFRLAGGKAALLRYWTAVADEPRVVVEIDSLGPDFLNAESLLTVAGDIQPVFETFVLAKDRLRIGGVVEE
jgi:hypothetical protein